MGFFSGLRGPLPVFFFLNTCGLLIRKTGESAQPHGAETLKRRRDRGVRDPARSGCSDGRRKPTIDAMEMTCGG
jgi:hypothetical protein